MYYYFIVYYYENINATGIGRLQITIDKKIDDFDTIEQIEQTIKNRFDEKSTSVIIVNYKLLNQK